MLKIYIKTFVYFYGHAHLRYEKSLFTIIQERKNMLKISILIKKLQTSWANISRTLRIKNAKFLDYLFYMNTNI